MIFLYAMAFITGILVKVVDWIEDETKHKSALKYPLAIAYGVMIGYLISNASFSMIFLGALFAQAIAGKVDCKGHLLGFITAAVSLLYFGFPVIDFIPFVIFFVFALMDELRFFGKYLFLSDYRPFLEIASLVFIPLGRWDYFLGIMSFDAGYLLFGKARSFF